MEHRVQQVLQTDVFVAPALRLGHRQLQRDLQFAAEHHAWRGHRPTPSLRPLRIESLLLGIFSKLTIKRK
jgi:hypothetical protein